MPPCILRRSKRTPLSESSFNIKVDKNDSGVFYQQLGFSPSAFLNTSSSAENCQSEMMTSTPARETGNAPKTPSIKVTPVVNNKTGTSGKKRKSFNYSRNYSEQKRPLLSTTPRTPTPLRNAPKVHPGGDTKLATIDEISSALMRKPQSDLSTPDHDYAKSGGDTTNETSDFTGSSKTALRRTLFETPCQNPMARPTGVNLFTEKELNAIEQMSTCFTPRKQDDKENEKPSNSFVSLDPINVVNPVIKTNLFQVPKQPQHQHRQQIRILPLVRKPMKVPIRRLPPRNLRFRDTEKKPPKITTPTQGDAFKTVAFGQSHDQKFLTEQARLIMKEINQAARF